MEAAPTAFWSFDRWPGDILRLVAFRLDIRDIIKLQLVGNRHLWARLTSEDILNDIGSPIKSWKDVEALTTTICTPNSQLRTLVLHIDDNDEAYSPAFRNQPISTRTAWLQALPRTIETLDFNFEACLNIWLRRMPFGTCHWSATGAYGYVPVFLCDLLPRLRHLRLKTNDWSELKILAPDVNVLRKTYWQGIQDSDSNTSEVRVQWSSSMMALWMQKLPRTLETLYLSPWVLAGSPLLLENLPPNLTVFGRKDAKPNLIQQPDWECNLPPSLFDSLVHYTWVHPAKNFATTISHFSSLESLDISGFTISGKQIQLLPTSLRSLRFRAGYDVVARAKTPKGKRYKASALENADLARLPRSLTRLSICNLKRESVEFLSLLPQSITSLALYEVEGAWDLVNDLADFNKGCLPHIRHFEFQAKRSSSSTVQIRLSSLSWVPCATLHTLKLEFENISIVCPETLLETWPKGLPNRIAALALIGPWTVPLTPYLAAHLPPTLTQLEMPHFNQFVMPKEFLGKCPRSLTSCTIVKPSEYYNDGIINELAWKERDLLILNPHYAAKDLDRLSTNVFAPPQLRYLAARLELGTNLLNPRRTAVSPDSLLKDRSNTPGLHFIQTAIPSKMGHELLFPNTLTAIELPLRISAKDTGVWNLNSLTSLKIEHLDNPVKITKSSYPPNLTTLHVGFVFDYSWLKEPVFASLNELSMPHPMVAAADFSVISALKRLKTLIVPHTARYHDIEGFTRPFYQDWDAEDDVGESDSPRVLESYLSIAPSITTLNIISAAVPRHYWSNLKTPCNLTTVNIPRSQIDAQNLARLAPNLTSLSILRIRVHDPQALYSGLPRDLETIGDLQLVQVLCPSVTRLFEAFEEKFSRTPTSDGISRIQWALEDDPTASLFPIHSLDDFEQMIDNEGDPNFLGGGEGLDLDSVEDEEIDEDFDDDDGFGDEGDDGGQWSDESEAHAAFLNLLHSRGALRNDKDEDDEDPLATMGEEEESTEEAEKSKNRAITAATIKLREECLQALPRSLKSLATTLVHPQFGRHLPPALTKLSVYASRRTTVPAIFEHLPESLCDLTLYLDHESTIFLECLPRNLTSLSLHLFLTCLPGQLANLPRGLKIFLAPQLSLSIAEDVADLPRSLHTLELDEIELSSMLHHLPPALTSFKLGIILDTNINDIKTLSASLPHLKVFNIDNYIEWEDPVFTKLQAYFLDSA